MEDPIERLIVGLGACGATDERRGMTVGVSIDPVVSALADHPHMIEPRILPVAGLERWFLTKARERRLKPPGISTTRPGFFGGRKPHVEPGWTFPEASNQLNVRANRELTSASSHLRSFESIALTTEGAWLVPPDWQPRTRPEQSYGMRTLGLMAKLLQLPQLPRAPAMPPEAYEPSYLTSMRTS